MIACSVCSEFFDRTRMCFGSGAQIPLGNFRSTGTRRLPAKPSPKCVRATSTKRKEHNRSCQSLGIGNDQSLIVYGRIPRIREMLSE
jgi:hypothetical protein